MDVEGLLDWAERKLKASPAIDHWQKDREEIEAEELLDDVIGEDVKLDAEVPQAAARRFEKMIARRAKGEPVALILGYAEFRGLRITARPGTFLPRDSSEFLAEQAIRRLKRLDRPVAVDVATGVGPVALAIKNEVRRAQVYGTDLSATAVTAARANARKLKVPVKFVRGNLFSALPRRLKSKVDVITLHPPYVGRGELRELPDEIRKFEPVGVLSDGSAQGLGLVESTAHQAGGWLRPGGWLLIEVSPDRARAVGSVMRRAGFKDIKSTKDRSFQVTRVVIGRA